MHGGARRFCFGRPLAARLVYPPHTRDIGSRNKYPARGLGLGLFVALLASWGEGVISFAIYASQALSSWGTGRDLDLSGGQKT
jgi:hypothetical protein